MALVINFSSNLDQVNASFKKGGDIEKALVKAARSALSKTLISYRKEVNVSIRTKIALKSGEINKEFLTTSKRLRGSKMVDLQNFEVSVNLKAKPVSLIRLVRGSKTPRSQLGKRVKSRGVLKIEINKGQVKKIESAFIAKTKQGNYQVFKRNPHTKSQGVGKFRTNKKIIVQSRSSPHYLFLKKEFRTPLEKRIGQRLQDLFVKEMEFQLNK